MGWKMEKKEKEVTNWCFKAPKALDALLEDAVKESDYATKSDLVRDAVRDKLEKMGFFYRRKSQRGLGSDEPN